ncbi:hypothetical protein OG320_08750 [Microbispora sp. NBC_01189]|uniref:hypothetical protein n=1 Tax=Microbispora sp. NBC_01189 TaxID=2903583 RepID=UPI002E138576|nr:hypothetical protein OG320_08750 [Microbispora sp. NBC_01189]
MLRARGAEPRLTRRTVVAALAGYVHLRAQGQEATGSAQGGAAQGGTGQVGAAPQGGAAQIREAVQMVAAMVRREIAPLLERVERLERHTGVAAPAEDEAP